MAPVAAVLQSGRRLGYERMEFSRESQMVRAVGKSVLGLCAAAGLAGCLTDQPRDGGEARGAVVPENYKAEIIAFMRTYLNDPANVRDAFITEPAIKQVGGRSQYAVCVRYNAKNTDGKYAGSRDSLAVFERGRFDRMIDQFPKGTAHPCAGAEYTHFPELEALRR
jgi:hypothetical protein